MRVAFYAPLKSPASPSPSGDRRMAQLLMRAIGSAGHAVVVASHHRSFDGIGDPERQRQLKAGAERQAAGLLDAYREQAAPAPELWFTYHLYHKAPDWIGPIVAKELGIPYVVAEASVAPKRAGGQWDIGHRGVLRALDQASLVIGFNTADAACVHPHLGAGATYAAVPPFIDTAAYRKAADERDVYRAMTAGQYALPLDQPWLLAVAMMRPGDKVASYQALAAALGDLSDISWRLLCVGDGDGRSDVKRAFAPFDGRVAWLGAQRPDALPGLYAASDLYVWPAVNEAYGMAFLEAQAAGLPVIAGDDGGVSGVVHAPDAGLLVEPGDAAAFARAVRRMLNDEAERRSIGERAKAWTETEHSLRRASQRIDVLLRELTTP